MSDVYDREADEPTEDETRIMLEELERDAFAERLGGRPIVVTKPNRGPDWFGIGFTLLVGWNVAATIVLLTLWATR